MEGISASIPYRHAAREISLAVLAELAPEEVEVALGFLDPLIEMAAGDELSCVGIKDQSGGFGGSDVLFASVVPAVVQALKRVGIDDDGDKSSSNLSEIENTLRRASSEIEKLAHRTGSRRAVDSVAELSRAIRDATLRHFAAQTSSV